MPCVYGISRRSGKRSAESYQAMKKSAELDTHANDREMAFLDGSLTMDPADLTRSSSSSSSSVRMDMLRAAHVTDSGLRTPPGASGASGASDPLDMDFLNSPASMETGDSESTMDSAGLDQYPSSPEDPCPDLPDYLKQQLKDWAFDNMFLPNLLPTPQISPRGSLCPSMFEKSELHIPNTMHPYDFSVPHEVETPQCFKPGSIYSTSPVSEPEFEFNHDQDFSDGLVPSIETDSYFDRQPAAPSHTTDTSPGSSSYSSRATDHQASAAEACRCNETIITHLSLLPEHHENRSYEMELAELQESLKLGSDVLNCVCAGKDDSMTLSMSLLVSQIVSVLERLCRRAREEEQNDGTPSTRGKTHFDAERFSLGMYQIAKEDEKRLKQEMLGLQIKKVELLIMCSREMVKGLMGQRQQSRRQPDTQALVSEKLFNYLAEHVRNVRAEWDPRNSES
ncbi:uncharacterized protein BP5553_09079 [Venustampulla echinocandica]|uniref:Aflatoxin regulatory protein domain-containing protein n=1 Tax=Venustampulla echinocandica TaxID=2656787 RepID=A0A370TDT0_9HELO|nr:uncharacterized protein BP5553_09079 [Venustampulla echinocandica]RDL32623.1 hypothetical protein BP5553_09079 [Venustampulla echinocandica]